MREAGADFVRSNMSHSSISQLDYHLRLAKLADLDFIIDTEGAQVRTGEFWQNAADLWAGGAVSLWGEDFTGDISSFTLKPHDIINQLDPGDRLHIGWDGAVIEIDKTFGGDSYLRGWVIESGRVTSNTGVYVERFKPLTLPPMTLKDLDAIALGREAGVEYLMLSMVRSPKSILEARHFADGMKIIAKVECAEGLVNLGGIMQLADLVMIDRGDLGKEVPVERIPTLQRAVIETAAELHHKPGVIIATNLLESMVVSPTPTHAEVADIYTAVEQGAWGLTLAAETAIGAYPIEAIEMMKRVIRQSEAINGR
jgi:pyruvate kinase